MVKDEVFTGKVILVCILGKTFSDAFLKCWTEFIGYCLMNNMRPILANICESSLFIFKNQCLMCDITKGTEQVPLNGETDYDYIFFLSSKCLFNPSNLIPRFLEMNKEIVSACSISPRNMKEMNFIQNVDFNGTKSYSFHSVEDAKSLIQNECHELRVDYVDTKCILFKRGVLEKIKYPWFSGDPTNMNGDTYFCQKCKENKIDIYVDLKVPVNQETTVVF